MLPLLLALVLQFTSPGLSPTVPPSEPAVKTSPMVLRRTEPQYSLEALKKGIQGLVTLKVLIHKDGSASVIKIVHGLGYGLDENATRALEQWKFKPATRNGEPVDLALDVTVTYRIRPKLKGRK